MRITSLGHCVGALASAFAASADYSWELSGGVAHAEWYEPNSPTSYLERESDHRSLGGTYHFDPVEDDSVPYALAPFFDPATRVSITTSREIGPRVNDARGEPKPETRDYAVSGQYLLRESQWYVGGRYSRGDRDDEDLIGTLITAISTDRRGYGVVVGKYFGAGTTRLELSLDRTETEFEAALRFCGLVCRDATTTAGAIEDEARVEVMHVGRLGSATYAVVGTAREFSQRSRSGGLVYTDMPPPPPVPFESDGADVHYITIGAQLFPTANFGLYVGYTRVNGLPDFSTRFFASNDRELDWGASWFFRRNVGLEVTLTSVEASFVNNLGAAQFENDRAALRLIGRF